MATIGKFTRHENGFIGTLDTLTVHAEITIDAVKSKKSDNAPDYRVNNGDSEIGAAWKRTSKEGAEYLSVSIDDPAFADKLYCRLVKTSAEHVHTLYWERQKPE